MAFAPIAAKSDADLKAVFEKYDALDPSSAGMDKDEFKEMLQKEFSVTASEAEIEAAYKAANNDDSAEAQGADLSVAEFLGWVNTIR